MTRRLTFHLITGMLILAAVLASAIGIRSYSRREADYQNLGGQNALLGARLTQFALERAVDNGLFDRQTLFQPHYERVSDRGAIRYGTEYDRFFDRNVVKILEAFQANDDIYYAYVINDDGFIPAHTEAGKSKTKRDTPDPNTAATSSCGEPCNLLVKNEDGYEFREFRAPILVDGELWGEFCVGIPVALANVRGREIAASTFGITIWFSLIVVGAMIYLIRRGLHPLEDLTEATRQMAAGNVAARCRHYRHDELGMLARSFNAMAETISRTQEGLERQVQDRTAQLRASEQLCRSLLDSSAVGIFHGSADRIILEANARACAMFGYTPAEMQGQSFQLIHLSDEHFRNFIPQYAGMKESGIASIDYPFRHKDGSILWCSAFGTPLDSHDVEKGYVWNLLDITALRETQALARRLSRAVEQTSTSVVMTDLQGNITFVNRGFCRTTGYEEQEVIGKNPRVLKSGDMPASLYREMWEKLTHGQQWKGELQNRRKNGELFWESAVIAPVTDEEGNATHFVAVKEDITERKRAEEQLQAYAAAMEASNRALEQSNRRAEQAARAKSEFLANMSHEIRTPMNGVIGMTGLLLDTDLTQEQRKYAEIARFSAESLLMLINDILDFSKIEAHKLDLETLDFDLTTVVEETAEMLAVKSHEKGLPLVCLIDPEIPSLVRGDPSRLRQILLNLGGNAVKFTSAGEVRIDVNLKSRVNRRVTVEFRVTDTGIGIPTDKVGGLFSPFTQVDGSTARKFGGTGLGLAICKQLAEMMDGQIGVESEVGKGSTFWCDIVLEELPAVRPADPQPADLEGLRVLVVDDHAANRLLVTTLLKTWGCRFAEAAGTQAALATIAEAAERGEPFQVALLDMHMPDGDGIELGRMIHRADSAGSIAQILLTSLGEHGDLRRLEESGFRGYLTKPIRRGQLRRCLASAVHGDVWPADSGTTKASLNQRLSGVVESVRILVAEDNPINQEVALTILKKQGIRADAVANGREALRALENIPYDLVLMDLQMPEMDGLETTRNIRDRASRVLNRSVPIIAMTANAMKADKEKCWEAGMDDFLTKPVQPADLLARIEHWISAISDTDSPERSRAAASMQLAQEAEVAAESTPELAELDASQPVLQFDQLCRRILGDRELALQLLQEAANHLDRDLAELHQAVDDCDAEAARKLAHKLKGTAANLSAEPLRWACYRLESAAAAQQIESLPQHVGQVEQAARGFRAAVESRSELKAPSKNTINPSSTDLFEESRS